MSRVLVGLTGGLAAGKSTVADWFREAGFRVIDADELVAELYQPGKAGTRAVREFFGDEVLDAQGGVDHVKLAREVFQDQESRRWLEAVVHPLVRRRFEELAGSLTGVVVLEATLLVESGYGPMFDLMVSVEAEPEVRLARAVARGLDEEEARRRLAAQGDGAQRRAAAQRVISNNGSLEELRSEVDLVVKEILALEDDPSAGPEA